MQQAKDTKADQTQTQTWGPGGVGGINSQTSLNEKEKVVLIPRNASNQWGPYEDYEDDRFGPGYATAQGVGGSSSNQTPNQGRFYGLMEAAEKQAEKVRRSAL